MLNLVFEPWNSVILIKCFNLRFFLNHKFFERNALWSIFQSDEYQCTLIFYRDFCEILDLNSQKKDELLTKRISDTMKISLSPWKLSMFVSVGACTAWHSCWHWIVGVLLLQCSVRCRSAHTGSRPPSAQSPLGEIRWNLLWSFFLCTDLESKW